MSSIQDFKTVLHNNYTEKTVTLETQVYNYINKISDEYDNRKISNGVVIYELMMMNNDYNDLISEHEQFINTELSDYLTRSQIKFVTNYTENNNPAVRMENSVPQRYPEKAPTDKIRDIKIRIPEHLEKQLDFKRGWNKKLKQAVENYINTPYTCRHHRIQVKQNIINSYKQQTQLKELSQELIRKSEQSSEQLETVKDYYDIADSLTTWAERKKKIAQVAVNCNLSKNHVHTMIKKSHGIDTESYRAEKINELWDEYNIPYHMYDSKSTIEEDNITKRWVINNKDKINNKYDEIYIAEQIDDMIFVSQHVNSSLKPPRKARKVTPIETPMEQ